MSNCLPVWKVCAALYCLALQYIQWPNKEEVQHIWTNIEYKYGFSKIIGVIDGTHIKIIKLKEHDESYINRKDYHSVQLQVSITKNIIWTRMPCNKSHEKI